MSKRVQTLEELIRTQNQFLINLQQQQPQHPPPPQQQQQQQQQPPPQQQQQDPQPGEVIDYNRYREWRLKTKIGPKSVVSYNYNYVNNGYKDDPGYIERWIEKNTFRGRGGG